HFIRQRFFNGAFAIGWWFGLGFFGAGLYWISFSFLVDAQQFAWMIPFALFGLSGVFAIYIGLVSALCFRLAGPGMRRVFYFAIIWVAFEWVRGWAFTGFPWNLIGTVWTFNEAMIQFASVLGVMGLSLVTMVAASSIAILGYGKKSPRFRYYGAGLPLLILALIWAGGMWRVGSAKNHVVENVQLRLVQPNIKQKNKWKSELRGKHFNNLLELSEAPLREPNGKKPTHIIWPETATPFFLDGNDAALRIMAQIIPKEGALLTGSPRRTGGRGEPVKLWNSLHVVGPDAKISATFDKFHLVPFGEYVPLRDSVGKFINIAKITTGRTDFSSGPGQRALEIPGAPPVSPLICYEVIFPGAATPAHSEGQARPGWLLNITNDAWFGTSSGPYQHLAAAQLRAVEEGLPVIRVANTGISAIIDSYGRIQVASRLSERIYLDGPLPAKLKNPTLFSRNGQWGLLVLILGFLLIAGRRRLD
ncbi:MAG: apolipoprotein N-acyltransferase, partial [Rhodospirillaceae bacterium]|nr:apolipoprotein N-acyltransferase [Rhodospirillaceae bacterium]